MQHDLLGRTAKYLFCVQVGSVVLLVRFSFLRQPDSEDNLCSRGAGGASLPSVPACGARAGLK